MKPLLFISTVFPTPWEPHKGPANTNLIAALRDLGVPVTVIAPVPWPTRFRARQGSDMPGTHYPVYWYPPGLLRERYDRTMWWSLRATLRQVSAMSSAPAAVLGFWAHPDGAVAVRHGEAVGIPSGVIAAGSDIMLLPKDPARRMSVSRTVSAATHVFGVGSEIVRRVVALGADPTRVTNFIQGVQLERFAPGDQRTARRRLGLPENGRMLLWVGNMVEVKAADRVITVASRLAKDDPELRVAMVGGGPGEHDLKAQAADSETLSGRMTFAGPVASEMLATWYQAADVLLLPSRSEGVPNVLLEAMATGLPFVASDVGGIADLLPAGRSCTVTEGDLDALEAAVRAVLRDTPTGERTITGRRDIRDGAAEIIRHLQLDRR